jgi:ankyrin repeat protein
MGTLEEKKKENLKRLLKASREGDVAAVRALLDSGNVDVHGVVNRRPVLIQVGDNQNGWTALHWASSEGHSPVVELLLKAGADRNAADAVCWILKSCRAFLPVDVAWV